MTHGQPRMMTIRQVAATGHIVYVNFDLLCEQFNSLGIIA